MSADLDKIAQEAADALVVHVAGGVTIIVIAADRDGCRYSVRGDPGIALAATSVVGEDIMSESSGWSEMKIGVA